MSVIMKACIVLILLLTQVTLYSQEVVMTKDGKKIRLNADKTWEFVEEPASDANNSSVDFRKASWGMSKDQIKSLETEKLEKEESDYLAYSGVVSTLEVYIFYVFVNDKLVRARYSFKEEHTNKNDYISDYRSINTVLTDKYGKPKSDKEYWANNLYKSDPEQRGFAVSLGHLKYYAEWDTQSSSITSALIGDNYNIDHVVEYASRQLGTLEDKKKKEKDKSEF